MLTDRQLSLPTTSGPYPGLCVDTYLGLLEMSVGARQFVIVGPQLVEHVKYSVSSDGQSESGNEARCLYRVCAICARHRHRELISLTGRTRRTSLLRQPSWHSALWMDALDPVFACLFALSVHQWNNALLSCLMYHLRNHNTCIAT